jgi:hypothetical protein
MLFSLDIRLETMRIYTRPSQRDLVEAVALR